MRKCICGSELKEKKEPCFFEDDCKGCALCKDGQITIVWCASDDCILRDVDLDDE